MVGNGGGVWGCYILLMVVVLMELGIYVFCIFQFQVFHLPVPDFMQKSVKELNIGTYTDLATVFNTNCFF